MKARKITLLAAILSAFALAACDKSEETDTPVEPPVTESSPATPPEAAPAVEVAPVDEANTLPAPADESEFSKELDETLESAKETTDELVERARETAAEASEKVKELTDSAIETTKQAAEEAKEKAEAAVESVRQSFTSETGVTEATVDPTEPIESEFTNSTSSSVTTDTPTESTATAVTEENPDLVGEIIEKTEEEAVAGDSAAERAFEEVKEAGVEVREAVETDLEDATNALSPSNEATTEAVLETDSQAGN